MKSAQSEQQTRVSLTKKQTLRSAKKTSPQAEIGEATAKPGWNDSTVVRNEDKKHVFRPQPLKAKSKSLRRRLRRDNSRASSIGSSSQTLNSLNYIDGAIMKTANQRVSNQEALEMQQQQMMMASSKTLTDFSRTTREKNHLFSPNPKAGAVQRNHASIERSSSLMASLAVTDKLKTVLKKSPTRKMIQSSSRGSLKLSSLNPSKQQSEADQATDGKDQWDQEDEIPQDENPQRHRFQMSIRKTGGFFEDVNAVVEEAKQEVTSVQSDEREEEPQPRKIEQSISRTLRMSAQKQGAGEGSTEINNTTPFYGNQAVASTTNLKYSTTVFQVSNLKGEEAASQPPLDKSIQTKNGSTEVIAFDCNKQSENNEEYKLRVEDRQTPTEGITLRQLIRDNKRQNSPLKKTADQAKGMIVFNAVATMELQRDPPTQSAELTPGYDASGQLNYSRQPSPKPSSVEITELLEKMAGESNPPSEEIGSATEKSMPKEYQTNQVVYKHQNSTVRRARGERRKSRFDKSLTLTTSNDGGGMPPLGMGQNRPSLEGRNNRQSSGLRKSITRDFDPVLGGATTGGLSAKDIASSRKKSKPRKSIEIPDENQPMNDRLIDLVEVAGPMSTRHVKGSQSVAWNFAHKSSREGDSDQKGFNMDKTVNLTDRRHFITSMAQHRRESNLDLMKQSSQDLSSTPLSCQAQKYQHGTLAGLLPKPMTENLETEESTIEQNRHFDFQSLLVGKKGNISTRNNSLKSVSILGMGRYNSLAKESGPKSTATGTHNYFSQTQKLKSDFDKKKQTHGRAYSEMGYLSERSLSGAGKMQLQFNRRRGDLDEDVCEPEMPEEEDLSMLERNPLTIDAVVELPKRTHRTKKLKF